MLSFMTNEANWYIIRRQTFNDTKYNKNNQVQYLTYIHCTVTGNYQIFLWKKNIYN